MHPTITVDGVEYAPRTAAPASLGIAIKTHNRPEQLAEALEHHLQHAPTGARIVVVDDGSNPPAKVPDGVELFRFEQSRGIVAAGNKCIELLMDAGCEFLALWDDDAWPIADRWWAPYEASPEAHLAYQFLDLSGPRKLRDIAVVYEDDEHVVYTGQRGVMLWYRREAIEKVGGFDPVYGRGMYEHSDLANRIHHAGLTTWRYADVVGSSDLIYSLDEHEKVKRSVGVQARADLVTRNAETHNRRRAERYAGVADYRERRDVVLTCLYGRDQDPQRPGTRMGAGEIRPLIASAPAGVDVVVHSDLDLPDVEHVEPSSLAGMNVFFRRWMDAARWLRAHPNVGRVLVCDATDVEILHDPFPHVEAGRLYVGYEARTIADAWMVANHPDPAVQELIRSRPHLPLLNAGVVLGDRATVLEFVHALASHYFDRKMNRFHEKDRAGDDLGDMGAFNLIAHTRFADRIEWGPHVTSLFKAEERSALAWIKHK